MIEVVKPAVNQGLRKAGQNPLYRLDIGRSSSGRSERLSCKQRVVGSNPTSGPRKKLIDKVIAFYGPICYLCKTHRANTVDHVVPKSRGGTNKLNNLRPACQPCNNEKANKSLLKYVSEKHHLKAEDLNLIYIR